MKYCPHLLDLLSHGVHRIVLWSVMPVLEIKLIKHFFSGLNVWQMFQLQLWFLMVLRLNLRHNGVRSGWCRFQWRLTAYMRATTTVLEQQCTLSPSSRLSNALTFADITYPVLSLSATIEHIEQPELKIVRKQLGTSTEAWSLKQAVRSIVQLAFPHGSTSLLHTKIIPRPQQANL